MRIEHCGLLIAVAIAASTTTARADGAAIPPMEVDFGAGAPLGGASATTGPIKEIIAGLDWAALAWFPTRIDIGIGFVRSSRGVVADYSGVVRRTDGATITESPALEMNGMYLQLGYRIAGGRYWRTWASARGELMWADVGDHKFSALGESLRIGTELYRGGLIRAPNGVLVGTASLGVYVEATHRDIAAELGPTSLTTGISLRIPFIVAS